MPVTKLFANEMTVENVCIYEDARHQMLIVDSHQKGPMAFELKCGMWVSIAGKDYLQGFLSQEFKGRLDFV